MYRRWTIVCSIGVIALLLGPRMLAQESPTPARPFIALDKARFASTEDVFFWVGVSAPGNYQIPASLRDTCRLTITRPDGTQKIERVGWPVDGMLDRGWRGGHGLHGEAPQVGRYTLVFEFAGHKSAPQTFVVEEIAAVRQISGEFLFPSPLLLRAPDAVVQLVIRNGSSQQIHFPHRGVLYGYVSVGLEKTTGEKWGSSFFVPEATLLTAARIERSTIGNDLFTWDLLDKIPTVTLAAGATYRLAIPLASVLASRIGAMPDGEYDVRFSTNVQVLLGLRGSTLADLEPVRLVITSVAHGVR